MGISTIGNRLTLPMKRSDCELAVAVERMALAAGRVGLAAGCGAFAVGATGDRLDST